MKICNTVGIVGVGLIGGSIGLALKKRRLCKQVVAVSRREQTLRNARAKGAIDSGSREFDILNTADIVILSAPVRTILELAPRVQRVVREDCLVMDVGSTKAEIVSHCQKLFPLFVGAHPLAGSEKKGVLQAQSELFNGSLCILTPTPQTKAAALQNANRFWQQLGASVCRMPPAQHDRVLAYISHLPHAVAYSLIGAVAPAYLKYAAAGLRDTTRIASSDPELWAEIFLSNKQNVLKSLASLEENLHQLKRAISRGNAVLLRRILQRAQNKRNKL